MARPRSHVRFEARNLYDDEMAVVRSYVGHLERCRICRIDASAKFTFCPRGYGYAKDVRQYLYMKDDQNDNAVYSEIDIQGSGQEGEVNLPWKYNAVRGVLRGRGRAWPRIRLRDLHRPRQMAEPSSTSPPSTYTDAEYISVLVRMPTTPIPLLIRRSDLERSLMGHNYRTK